MTDLQTDQPTNSVYGAGTLKRRRRTKAQIEQLDRQIVEALTEDHPQSVRHVFYRMTDPRLLEPVEKSESGYRTIQRRVLDLRDTGRVPYRWVSDASRRGYHVNTFDDKADFLRRMKGLYRADIWQDADVHCEVWVESRSIAGIVQADCEELAISLYPAGGFTSATLAYEAAESLNRIVPDNTPVVIFCVGDHDPAGVLIDVAIEKELRRHLNPDIDLTFERMAITPLQIESLNLPTKPRKVTGKRSLHIQETVEAESVPAATMRSMLRQRVEALLPDHALMVAKAEEESVQDYFDNLADLLEGDDDE